MIAAKRVFEPAALLGVAFQRVDCAAEPEAAGCDAA
jgi:hypothetical protein